MTDDQRYYMTWSEVHQRLADITPTKPSSIYGIPRGGAIVAGLMFAAERELDHVLWDNADPAQDTIHVDLVVDDIIDTGKTAERAEKNFQAPVVALVDKRKPRDAELGWVVFPWEERDPTADIHDTVVRQLEFIGEDPTRPGLVETPARYIKALREITSGLGQDPKAPLAKVFDESHDEIVCVRGIEFHSICEHHLLGFSGVVHFAYLPNGQVVGLSKIPRMIEILSRRPQVQENLTSQIVSTFEEVVKPRGAMAVVTATHSCMKCRGVRSTGEMVTSVVRGVFMEKPEARAEAMALMGMR